MSVKVVEIATKLESTTNYLITLLTQKIAKAEL